MSSPDSDPHAELLGKSTSSPLYARSCASIYSSESMKSSSLSSQTSSSNSLSPKCFSHQLMAFPSPAADQKSHIVPNKKQSMQMKYVDEGLVSDLKPGKSSKIVDQGLACRLHVSNLPFIFREVHLARLFSSFGTVTDAEVVTNEKGSKGFGFVSLSSPEEAAAAQRALHGAVIEGRRIEVNRATPRVRPPLVGSRSPFVVFGQVKYQSQMLELVEAQTRLAEAQLAVLQMRNTIFNSQDMNKKTAESNPNNI